MTAYPSQAAEPRRTRATRFPFEPRDLMLFQGRAYAYVRAMHGGHVFRPLSGGAEQFVTDPEMRGIMEHPTFLRRAGRPRGAAAAPGGSDALRPVPGARPAHAP